MLAVMEEIERVAVAGLRPHPAAADVPKMCGAEWASFLADVGRRGIQEPLVVLAGTDLVLDGRHRLDAAELSGADDVPVRYVDLPETEQVDYVIRAAICRRHLTDSQRALLAAKLATVGRGNGHSEDKGAIWPVQTVDQAAEMLNVSPRTVKRARQVVANGHSALVEAIASGDAPVASAAKLLELPPDQQREVVAGGRESIRGAVSGLNRRASRKTAKPGPKTGQKLDLPAVKQAFLGLSEEDRMAFFREAFTSVTEEERMAILDWIDHASFAVEET